MALTGFMVIYCGLGAAPPLFSTEAISLAIVCTRTSSWGGGGVNPPEGGGVLGGGGGSGGGVDGSEGAGGIDGVGVSCGGTPWLVLFCCDWFNESIM